jgi:hypothetical protein
MIFKRYKMTFNSHFPIYFNPKISQNVTYVYYPRVMGFPVALPISLGGARVTFTGSLEMRPEEPLSLLRLNTCVTVYIDITV